MFNPIDTNLLNSRQHTGALTSATHRLAADRQLLQHHDFGQPGLLNACWTWLTNCLTDLRTQLATMPQANEDENKALDLQQVERESRRYRLCYYLDSCDYGLYLYDL